MMQTNETKPMSLNQFAKSLGFSLSGAKSWLVIPEFQSLVKVVRKGRVNRYYVTDPKKAKEVLKKAGYILPVEEGNA